jgi:Ca2+-binding EF-hand superfamily protein
MNFRRRAFAAVFAFGTLLPVVRAFPTADQVLAAFRAIDTTGNDAISPAEWERASTALFRAADKDKSGAIDAEEAKVSNVASDTFLRIDLNHDGRLSLDEFMTLRREIFAVADRNRDDYVTLVEFELLIVFENVGWQDRNANGRMDADELRAVLEKLAELLDRDHDGLLDASEAAYMPSQRFARFDKNQDGKLSLEELVVGYRGEFEA